MYPKNNLSEEYFEYLVNEQFSTLIPDVTKKATLMNINFAINLAPKWEFALDIGGATGHYLASMHKRFKECHLVEITSHPEHKTILKRYSNIKIFNKMIEDFETDQVYDFIMMIDLYEHIPDIDSFVQKVASLQVKGGVVYILTPNPLFCGPATESGLYYKKLEVPTNGHQKHYTAKEISEQMRKYGYELELTMFEEANLRKKVKRVLFALSRREKKLEKFLLYRATVQPLVLLLTKIPLVLIKNFVYKSELRHRHEAFATMSHGLVFKKVR